MQLFILILEPKKTNIRRSTIAHIHSQSTLKIIIKLNKTKPNRKRNEIKLHCDALRLASLDTDSQIQKETIKKCKPRNKKKKKIKIKMKND